MHYLDDFLGVGRPGVNPTHDILLRLLATLNQRPHRGVTLYAAFCLAFAAILHIGKFTWEAHQ